MKIPACRVSESCVAFAIAMTTADSPATPSGRCSWLMWSQGAPAKSRTARETTGRPCGRRTGGSLAFISDDIEGRDFTTNTQVKVVSIPDGETGLVGRKLSPTCGPSRGSPDGEGRSRPIGVPRSRDVGTPRSAWLYVPRFQAEAFRRVTDGPLHPRTGVRDCPGLRRRGVTFVGAHSGGVFSCAASVPTAADSRPSRAEV